MKLFCSIVIFLFSLTGFCQSSATFISEEEALFIAKKYGRLHTNKSGWNLNKPVLDTSHSAWEISSHKITFTRRGKTSKHYNSDIRRPCRRVNGCHVIRTRSVRIDASSGKVVRRFRKKKTSGNYE